MAAPTSLAWTRHWLSLPVLLSPPFPCPPHQTGCSAPTGERQGSSARQARGLSGLSSRPPLWPLGAYTHRHARVRAHTHIHSYQGHLYHNTSAGPPQTTSQPYAGRPAALGWGKPRPGGNTDLSSAWTSSGLLHPYKHLLHLVPTLRVSSGAAHRVTQCYNAAILGSTPLSTCRGLSRGEGASWMAPHGSGWSTVQGVTRRRCSPRGTWGFLLC